MRARRVLAGAMVVGLATVALAAPSQADNEATVRPRAGASFIEHFDGPLDTSFWYISDGYNNGSHQNCQFNRNNVTVANGILSLTITDTPYGDRDYSCGSIQTNQKYGYGIYETRMKVGKASGTNSAFFTYAGPYQGVPQSHEIDFETLGKDTTKTEVNSWVNGDPKGPAIVDLGLDNSQQFVNLAFEWTANKLTFYVNGVAKHSFRGDDVPYEPQLIIPMIWSTDTLTSWMGPFEYPGHPIVTEYSVVSYTAPGDPCQWSGSIVC